MKICTPKVSDFGGAYHSNLLVLSCVFVQMGLLFVCENSCEHYRDLCAGGVCLGIDTAVGACDDAVLYHTADCICSVVRDIRPIWFESGVHVKTPVSLMFAPRGNVTAEDVKSIPSGDSAYTV